MTAEQVESALGSNHGPVVERVLGSHTPPPTYEIRETVMFGLAECRRAAMARDILEAGRLDRFGLLMARSHDGDRVATTHFDKAKPSSRPFRYDCGDAALRSLQADLRSEDPDRVLAAQLWMQPGGYRCSTPQIDQMVDLAQQSPGVIGAQLSGAGLGGCVMVLVRDDAIDAVRRKLIRGYYQPHKLEPSIDVCIPVQGSGLLAL